MSTYVPLLPLPTIVELATSSERISLLQIEELGELQAAAIDTALDCSDRATRDLRGFFVGHARGPDQHDRLALGRREQVERLESPIGDQETPRLSVSSSLLGGYDEPEILPSSSR